MKYALIVIVPPEPSGTPIDEKMNRFFFLAEKLSKTGATSKGVLKIHPHVWQIKLSEGLSFLALCVDEKEVSSQVVFLDELPEWVSCNQPSDSHIARRA